MPLDPLAQDILAELSRRPESGQIVLGGYFALRRHIDYRNTHDIDAWWKRRADERTENAIREAMAAVAAKNQLGSSERRFGETLSVELSAGKQKVFSFQIAVRSVELETPIASDWPPILIETLKDTIASKMNALVDRGSPRDLTDIYRITTANLATPKECWSLWERKNRGEQSAGARQNVLLHVAALEQRRPISGIINPDEKDRAEVVRRWFREEFCRP